MSPAKKTAMFAIMALGVVITVSAVILSSGSSPYQVRAIFDNAGFIIPGEDVKVAGVKVGTVDSLSVTEDKKAAIVLTITEEGYKDFRSDASCTIRPQSLIGEKFVECKPTQVRASGEELPPPLAKVASGSGKGQHLLPIAQTGKPVDLDLVNNIMRRPYTERLSLIINELGIGLAGRGEDLNEVIRRANPTLKELDKVLALLASQNETLGRLAKDGDAVLAPLARERKSVSGFVKHASDAGRATVQRRAEMEATLQKLPKFLRELRPTMDRLGGLSDEMTPVLRDIGAVAPDVNRFLIELGPFAKAGRPAIKSLGEAAEVGTPAVKAAGPIAKDLRSTAGALRPVTSILAALLASLEKSGGIERAMDFVFNQATAINGYDTLGHYLRASLIVNTCSNYAVKEQQECLAKFSKKSASAPAAQAATTAQAAAKPAQATKAAQGNATPASKAVPAKTSRSSRNADSEELLDYLFGDDSK